MIWTNQTNKTIFGINEPIRLNNCSNITIVLCRISNAMERGIYLYRCKNILIINCAFTNLITGVLADHCGAGIIIVNNLFKNMLGPMPAGQAVQFNTTSGPNCVIGNNAIFNYPQSGNPEDAINMYKSNGTADSPILIVGNKIRGGGPGESSGGIMLGDNGGSWQVAYNNLLVDPGQYGCAIAGGDNISLLENYIYGRQQPFTNVGLYVWGQNGAVVTNKTVRNNRVNFTDAKGMKNNVWYGDGLPVIGGVVEDNTLTADIISW